MPRPTLCERHRKRASEHGYELVAADVHRCGRVGVAVLVPPGDGASRTQLAALSLAVPVE